MNKELRMKNTPYYEYINVNPKDKFVGDCVVRAIALACGQTWEETVREMTELGIKKGMVLNDRKLYPLYLKSKGFVQMLEPRNFNGTKMTVKEWLDNNHLSGNIVINVGSHHVSCIIHNKVRDTWDCSHDTMHKWWMR